MSLQVNPQELIQMIRGGQNPQQLMLNILSQQANSPFGVNLLNLARQGDSKQIEQIVRNLYAQQGGSNFDEDFKNFKQQWGLL